MILAIIAVMVTRLMARLKVVTITMLCYTRQTPI